MSRVLVFDNGGEKGVGVAQVKLFGKRWEWSHTEPPLLPNLEAAPLHWMGDVFSAWHWPGIDLDLDIALLFRLVYQRESRVSLEEAIDLCGFKFVGDPENPTDRAYNVAHILAELFNRRTP